MGFLQQGCEFRERPTQAALDGAGCYVECVGEFGFGPVEVEAAHHDGPMVDRELTERCKQRSVAWRDVGGGTVDESYTQALEP
jgi:hypothetical protein